MAFLGNAAGPLDKSEAEENAAEAREHGHAAEHENRDLERSPGTGRAQSFTSYTLDGPGKVRARTSSA